MNHTGNRRRPASRTEINQMIDLLGNEVTTIHTLWSEYSVLFRSKENWHVVWQVASGFFFLVRRVFFDEMMLSMCRLDDAAITTSNKGNHEHLTFRRLFDGLDDRSLQRATRQLYESRQAEISLLKADRHKRLAHNDLPTKVMEVDRRETNVDYETIDAVLTMYRQVMNLVERHYEREEQTYLLASPFFGAATLAHKLKAASLQSLESLDSDQ